MYIGPKTGGKYFVQTNYFIKKFPIYSCIYRSWNVDTRRPVTPDFIKGGGTLGRQDIQE